MALILLMILFVRFLTLPFPHFIIHHFYYHFLFISIPLCLFYSLVCEIIFLVETFYEYLLIFMLTKAVIHWI